MLKNIFVLFAILFTLLSSTLFASEPSKNLTLKIEFYSKPNGEIYEHPLHINKTIKIDANQASNTIIMTESKIENNFPVTLAMLVKPVEISNKEVSLKFNLVQYSFLKRTSIITQPGLVLRNGQTGEMKNELFKLKVKAKWDV